MNVKRTREMVIDIKDQMTSQLMSILGQDVVEYQYLGMYTDGGKNCKTHTKSINKNGVSRLASLIEVQMVLVSQALKKFSVF